MNLLTRLAPTPASKINMYVIIMSTVSMYCMHAFYTLIANTQVGIEKSDTLVIFIPL